MTIKWRNEIYSFIKKDSKFEFKQDSETRLQYVYIDLIVLAIISIDSYEEQML
jgi:hypothetical protein